MSNRLVRMSVIVLIALLISSLIWMFRSKPVQKSNEPARYTAGSTNRIIVPLTGTNPPAPPTLEVGGLAPPLTFPGASLVTQSNLVALSNYLPMGKLLPCITVFAIDSSQAGAPIIAIVAEDVGHQGTVVIPRGSYLHGWAQRGRMRDRILSQQNWVIVFPSGEELGISAIALEADKRSENSWGPLDGSLGIRGALVRSDHWAETKIFVAAFLSGAADALKSRERTLLGSEVTPQFANSALNGTGAVLDLYSREVLDRMESEQFVVRVAAPKSFYVYCLAMVDRNRASVGSTRWVTRDSEETLTSKKGTPH